MANSGGRDEGGVADLLASGRIRKLICSYVRADSVAGRRFAEGKLELEIVPQGTLAERLRVAGAGVQAFYTPTGADTLLAEGRETRVINGRNCLLEYPLPGDVALVDAWEADRWGNLTHRESARNFNPVMAMAAKLTIVQTRHVVRAGRYPAGACPYPRRLRSPRAAHPGVKDPIMADSEFAPLDRAGIARRIARDIPEGWFVNLGIGIPTGVSDYVPADREVIFHSENGVIGAGPAPPMDQINPYMVNAGTQPITLRTGGSFVHHADSFAIARGGHLDLCVLGAFEVAENGDIANWARSPHEATKQVGGAMDLAIGASDCGWRWSTSPRATADRASGGFVRIR